MSARSRSRVRRAIELGLGLAFVGIWAMTLRPTSLGGPATYVVVRGDSMLPTFRSGDLVILQTAVGYAPGDAVGYHVPGGEIGESALVVHRIASGDGQGGFTMLGDNNPAPDPWVPRESDVAGRAWLVIPGVGRLISFMHQPAAAGALAAGLVVLLMLARPASGGRRRDEPLGDGARPAVPVSGVEGSA